MKTSYSFNKKSFKKMRFNGFLLSLNFSFLNKIANKNALKRG